MHESALAQVPTRDTLRTRRDSARADSLRGRRDSVRVRGDSLRRGPDSAVVGVPLPSDPARADSVRARARADSIRAAELARKAADTVKAPIARAESPPDADIGTRYRWSREELFSSGALTLGELLGRVPGVTAFTSGWVATPHTNAYLGDFGRIRVFYDGVELDALDVRIGRMLDFSAIPIWTLEDLVVERAAEELRVYLRSWRVEKTTPYTRVDVSTGDLSTNSYRGFFGRRFANGGALQLGAQQYSTQDPRLGGDGDLLGILGRVGWAKKQWSVDAVLLRTSRTRTEEFRDKDFGGSNLPALDAVRSDAYVRVGYGDPGRTRWLQLIAASSRFVETNEKTAAPTTPPSPDELFAGDTVDTTASRAQYLVTGGLRRGGASLSAAGRLRVFDSRWFLSPSARFGFERGPLSVSAFGEQEVSDSTMRVDVTARVTPFRFLAFGASVGRTSAIENSHRPTTLAYRGEAGLRVGRLWATGGILSIDTAIVPGPRAYDTLYQAGADLGSHRGTFVGLGGPVWKALGVSVLATKWPTGIPYLPQYQVRSELYFSTSWLSRFPTGNFHILASATHEYRTQVGFPTPAGADSSSQYRVISTLLELRLYDAVLSWQYRNILGEIYRVVPGFTMPRAINFYGVRWQFFN